MNLITIARRANLGSGIEKRLKHGFSNLKVGQVYFSKVINTSNLTKEELDFHCSVSLSGMFSVVESVIKDIAVDYLTCFPGHLKQKNISLEKLSEYFSITDAIRKQAEATVNGWAYERFAIYISNVVSLLNKQKDIEKDIIEKTQEFKATRDIYMHNGGFPNAVYFSKAGKLARQTESNKKLEINVEYINTAFTTLTSLLENFDSVIPQNIKNYKKARAFQDMWAATVLEKLLPFNEAWFIEENGSMVRPNNEALKRYWSHSEKRLLDFFLGVFSTDYPLREYNIHESIDRWPPSTNEGKIMVSWLDCPFWF